MSGEKKEEGKTREEEGNDRGRGISSGMGGMKVMSENERGRRDKSGVKGEDKERDV